MAAVLEAVRSDDGGTSRARCARADVDDGPLALVDASVMSSRRRSIRALGDPKRAGELPGRPAVLDVLEALDVVDLGPVWLR